MTFEKFKTMTSFHPIFFISLDQCMIKNRPNLKVKDDLHCNLQVQANTYPEYLEGPHGILYNHFPLKLLAKNTYQSK